MTKEERQRTLLDAFLASAGGTAPLYRSLADCLTGLGYRPQKERSHLSFKHDLHNKQIAKMGIKKTGESAPFFALRFSACRGYSQRFADAVGGAIKKYPSRTPGCVSGGCGFCAGKPDTHVYTHIFENGERGSHCGAYTLEIPDMRADDLEEIRKLIKEEHEYLSEHEINRT